MILPLGAVLAGGRGRRIGGAKATVPLEGRALIAHPLAALRDAGLPEVAVVAKASTALPALPAGVARWVEPDEPRHPLTGVVHALLTAGGRPVLACAADLPCLTAEVVRAVALADRDGAPAVVPLAAGRLQPLFAVYHPEALPTLERALEAPAVPVREAVSALRPRVVPIEDADAFLNVNTPADLAAASALLERRRAASAAPLS